MVKLRFGGGVVGSQSAVVHGLMLTGAVFVLVAEARVLQNLSRLLVLVEDRLCCGIVYPKLVSGPSNRVSLEDQLK